MSPFKLFSANQRVRWIFVIGALFSIGGILFLLTWIDPQTVLETMKEVNLGYFALSTLIAILLQILLAMRWRLLLNNRPSLWHASTASFVGLSINAVTPLRLGEIVRAGLMRRSEDIPMSESIPSIILGQLLDLLALATLGIVVYLTVPLPPSLNRALLLVGVVSVLTLGGLYFVTRTSSGFRQRLKIILTSNFGARVTQLIQRLETRIRSGLSTLHNLNQFLYSVLLSLLFWSILGLANWLLLPTFIDNPSIWIGITIAFASGLGRVAPALPGDIGTLDLIVTLSLVALGVPEEIAITVALLIRIRYVIMVVTIGLIGITGEGIGLARIGQIVQESQNDDDTDRS